MDAGRIYPPHRVTDKAKLAALVDAFEADGWQGRAVLVEQCGDSYYAWTGSHRLAAAKATDTDVPVLVVQTDNLIAAGFTVGEDGSCRFGLYQTDDERFELTDDEPRARALRLAGFAAAADIADLELDK